MPRRPRSYHAGVPVHVVQRGVNRQPCFFGDSDRVLYLETLGAMCGRYGVQLHAYVLMTNHVHLLVTPVDTQGISRVMQGLGRIYVCRVNQRVGRTGTLWEGRHRDSLIDSDNYLLRCQRYIERNPQRAGMVEAPGDYRWSSHRANASGAPGVPISPHAVYLGLGSDPAARHVAYRNLFELEDEQGDEAIRSGMEHCYPVGCEGFVERMRSLGVPVGKASRGRPRSGRSEESELPERAGLVNE